MACRHRGHDALHRSGESAPFGRQFPARPRRVGPVWRASQNARAADGRRRVGPRNHRRIRGAQMKESRITVALIRATPALAMAAPIVLLGFIYVLAVEPSRAAEQAARTRARTLAMTAGRMQSLIRNTTTTMAAPVAQREFE